MKKFIAVFTTLLICLTILCACTPDIDGLKAKYENNGYDIESISAEYVTIYQIANGYEQAFVATKGKDRAFVVSYKDGNSAKKLYDFYYYAENNSTVFLSNWRVVKKGSVVIFGTADAVNIA